MNQITCEICGKKKTMKRRDAKVCSPACRVLKSMKKKLTEIKQKRKK